MQSSSVPVAFLGWAITNTLLDGYPTPELFSKVSALTNRPLSLEIAQWPPSHGVDLLQHGGQHALENELQMKVTNIESITHVYFSGRAATPHLRHLYYANNVGAALIKIADPDEDIKLNVQMLERAVGAIEHLSKNLKFVVLPAGTMYGTPTSRDWTVETAHLMPQGAYGMLLIDKFPFPLHENLPRIWEPYASKTVFYYILTD
ncbi:hypothetical protein DFH08DRAFT_1050243 [Mycena albidolilacea]|uniref:PRISE-like Rossmann-fold domain-containing protein n=1 Tax=Mycena albidolilacea TaxID=1033008 RepID=A0AAD7EB63_9AGAR|nr:hypothetical protein DFH08DRAFT_1050243 [Mycena albidolilacea]